MKSETLTGGSRLAFIALCTALLAGCGKDEIKTYSVAKDTNAPSPTAAQAPMAPAPSMADMANAPGAPRRAETAPLHWTTPAGWQELAPTQMRVGNFLVKNGEKQAEVSIIPFPGEVGTEIDNVNRWRRELSLEPIMEKDIVSVPVQISAEQGRLYELTGTETATLAAVLMKDNISWFFKVRGEKSVVLGAKASFLELLKSIHFSHPQPPSAVAEKPPEAPIAPTPAPEPARVAATAPATKEATDDSTVGEPKWSIPANWHEQAAGPMVLKSFTVTDDNGGQAKISISAFPGDVGGKLANVNRWRGQLGLEPTSEADLSTFTKSVDVLGGKATLVDMSSAGDKKTRLVAAMVSHSDQTWFYKITGDAAVVEKEKTGFLNFVETIRYPSE